MNARSSIWRAALFGLIAGIWLSIARAPLGVDWIEIPAADGRTQRWFRAAGLGVVALAWIASAPRARSRSTLVSWCAALGFALHGAFVAHVVEATGWWSLAFGSVVAGVALALVTRKSDEDTESAPAIPLELLGYLAAGAGIGLALDRVANTLRMTSFGRPQDDTAAGATFLLLVAFGATAFGPLVARARVARFALPILAVLATAACWESVHALNAINDRDGFEAFLRDKRWHLDPSRVGQLDGDFLVAARVLIVPAFVLGALLACARDRRRFAALIGGAALQFALVGRGSVLPTSELPFATARAVALAASIAALGAVWAIAMFVERSARDRAIAAAGCALLGVAVWFAPRVATLPLTPWEAVAPLPYWTASTDAGLATVERARDASRIATLDRRRLTPLDHEQFADAQRFRLLGPAKSVLLVGQLTPARVGALKKLGVERVDRTAVWWRAMSAMDLELFEDSAVPISGDVLEPSLARERAEAGAYDAIVVPPIAGASPTIELPSLPPRTRMVAWLDARAPIVARYWGERVLLSSEGGEQLAIGVVNADLGVYPAGAQSFEQLPLTALLERRVERPFTNEARTCARLARGARGTAHEKLAEGLALHFAAQVDSSPYESRAQQVEVEPAALELLRDAALAGEPDAFVRELWNVLAGTLVAKRDVEDIERFVAPLAERWRPWPALECALASADLEQLSPQTAIEHLKVALEATPQDIELQRFLARALASAGRASEAVHAFEAALALAPERRDLRRELEMARVRAGDPAARASIEELLREDPDDEEIRRYLAPGPPPPAPPALAPSDGRD